MYNKTIRVEIKWLTYKNLQVSCKFVQGDPLACKSFFQKLTSSYKLIIRLRSSYKFTIQLTSSYKLTIRLKVLKS